MINLTDNLTDGISICNLQNSFKISETIVNGDMFYHQGKLDWSNFHGLRKAVQLASICALNHCIIIAVVRLISSRTKPSMHRNFRRETSESRSVINSLPAKLFRESINSQFNFLWYVVTKMTKVVYKWRSQLTNHQLFQDTDWEKTIFLMLPCDNLLLYHGGTTAMGLLPDT